MGEAVRKKHGNPKHRADRGLATLGANIKLQVENGLCCSSIGWIRGLGWDGMGMRCTLPRSACIFLEIRAGTGG